MTYQALFQLKYKEGLSTVELVKRFPQEVSRVSTIALLDIPEETLREVVNDEEFTRLMRLKKRFSGLF